MTLSLIWFCIFKGFAFGANSAWVFKTTNIDFPKKIQHVLLMSFNKLGLIVLPPFNNVIKYGTVSVIVSVGPKLYTRMGLFSVKIYILFF